jgi:hypothetical protein
MRIYYWFGFECLAREKGCFPSFRSFLHLHSGLWVALRGKVRVERAGFAERSAEGPIDSRRPRLLVLCP